MPDEPDLPGVIAEQRELLARLRAVVEAKMPRSWCCGRSWPQFGTGAAAGTADR